MPITTYVVSEEALYTNLQKDVSACNQPVRAAGEHIVPITTDAVSEEAPYTNLQKDFSTYEEIHMYEKMHFKT